MRRRLTPSRAAARRAILDGQVVVAGVPEPKPATLVADDAAVRLSEQAARYVGRGGDKLAAALAATEVVVEGRRALDVGASTGGFTDCLLQHGAATVVAVDVGYGQIDWRLRTDPRVTVVERTNFRTADVAALGAPFDVVAADLSFISLTSVANQLAAAGGADTDHLLLVKPQFEVGRERVGSGGVVRDPAARADAVLTVAAALADAGLGVRAVVPSPVPGAKGNRELFLWARAGEGTVDAEVLEEVARS